MKFRVMAFLATILLTAAVAGCRCGPASSQNSGHSGKTDQNQLLSFTGTIRHINLEGGFYAIILENGKKYVPINLSEEFKEEGMKVKVSAQPKPDRMSFHMYGTLIEIKNISRMGNNPP